jgi:hypothetical protein
MANSTQQFPINAVSSAVQVLGADPNRRYMMIRNYSDSAQIIWVAFGTVATCGNAGELEVLAGYTYEFGTTRLVAPNGLVANNETFPQPNCPLEYVSVICGARNSPTGAAVGAIMVVTP